MWRSVNIHWAYHCTQPWWLIPAFITVLFPVSVCSLPWHTHLSWESQTALLFAIVNESRSHWYVLEAENVSGHWWYCVSLLSCVYVCEYVCKLHGVFLYVGKFVCSVWYMIYTADSPLYDGGGRAGKVPWSRLKQWCEDYGERNCCMWDCRKVREKIERAVWGEPIEIHFQFGSELLPKLISADLFRV